MFLFFFFFSSRRRHTRFDCDWSSDVCSSGLRVFRRSRTSVFSEQGAGPSEVKVRRYSGDRKSTRLNSSHSQISYAVFCLKKKIDQPLELHDHTGAASDFDDNWMDGLDNSNFI